MLDNSFVITFADIQPHLCIMLILSAEQITVKCSNTSPTNELFLISFINNLPYVMLKAFYFCLVTDDSGSNALIIENVSFSN